MPGGGSGRSGRASTKKQSSLKQEKASSKVAKKVTIQEPEVEEVRYPQEKEVKLKPHKQKTLQWSTPLDEFETINYSGVVANEKEREEAILSTPQHDPEDAPLNINESVDESDEEADEEEEGDLEDKENKDRNNSYASEEDIDDPDEGGDIIMKNSDNPNKSPVRIIRLGTEEVKKYAIIRKKENNIVDGEDDDDEDDDEDYHREDREIREDTEDEEAETNKEISDWLNNYDKQPEETTLRVAKKYQSKQKFPCPKCDKVWNWPWELRRHLMIHFKPQKLDSGNSYKCPNCDRKFQWKRDMKQHERIHTGDKLLICSVCEKKFTTRQALLHHVVVHTGEKPFQCAVCGNRFTQPANLRTHVKKKHNYSVESNKQNKCEYCGEPHASIVGLHQHLLEDHPAQVQQERELIAQEKHERLTEKLRLQKKREEKRAKREISKKRKGKQKEWEMEYEFYIGEGLVRGVDWDRTPSNGEIACGQCDRKFGWRYEIMFHGLCHLTDEQGNAKNKICPECDTPFKVPIGLKHHLINHTGETPFLCLHCWKSFSSHIDLKLHIKREHLMHLNTNTGTAGVAATGGEEPAAAATSPAEGAKKKKVIRGPVPAPKSEKVDEPGVETTTTHYVQMEDGSYAQMVEGHEMVQPGQQMLVQDQYGQQLVVVNPALGDQPQTIVVPENAETVYVIASQDGRETIVPEQMGSNNIEDIMKNQDDMQMVVDENGDQKFIVNTDVISAQAPDYPKGTIILGVDQDPPE